MRYAEPEASSELIEFLFSRMRGRDPFLPYPRVPHVVMAAGE